MRAELSEACINALLQRAQVILIHTGAVSAKARAGDGLEFGQSLGHVFHQRLGVCLFEAGENLTHDLQEAFASRNRNCLVKPRLTSIVRGEVFTELLSSIIARCMCKGGCMESRRRRGGGRRGGRGRSGRGCSRTRSSCRGFSRSAGHLQRRLSCRYSGGESGFAGRRASTLVRAGRCVG